MHLYFDSLHRLQDSRPGKELWTLCSLLLHEVATKIIRTEPPSDLVRTRGIAPRLTSGLPRPTRAQPIKASSTTTSASISDTADCPSAAHNVKTDIRQHNGMAAGACNVPQADLANWSSASQQDLGSWRGTLARSRSMAWPGVARAVPTPAASSRTARLGLIRAWPCRTRLSVTREIPEPRGGLADTEAKVGQHVLAQDLAGMDGVLHRHGVHLLQW